MEKVKVMEKVKGMQLIKVKKKELFVDWDFNCRGKVNPSAPKTLALAADIAENGLQNPLIVSRSEVATENGFQYQLVAGHRRYTALLVNGDKEFDCILKDLSLTQMILTNLTENVQREDLNIAQEAKGVETLRNTGMSLQQIADKIGMSFGWCQVRNMFTTIPEDIQEEVLRCKFTTNNIRDLYTLRKEPEKQYELCRVIKTNKGDKKVNIDKFKDSKPKSKKKLRRPGEIHDIQEMLHGLLGPNIINVTLGWVNAEVSDLEFHQAIQKELDIYDIPYTVPDFA